MSVGVEFRIWGPRIVAEALRNESYMLILMTMVHAKDSPHSVGILGSVSAFAYGLVLITP